MASNATPACSVMVTEAIHELSMFLFCYVLAIEAVFELSVLPVYSITTIPELSVTLVNSEKKESGSQMQKTFIK